MIFRTHLDNGINNDIITAMDKIIIILEKIRNNPADIKFSDLCKICEYYFGKPPQEGKGHKIFQTPSPGDPRVIVQNKKGKGKAYQVRQVLKAIDKLEAGNGN